MRILIIEDEEKLAHSIKKGLEKEGHAVDCLYDGISGKRRIEIAWQDYDLVILDLMLPGKTGFEVCKEVRELGINVPILILTARDTLEDKVKALDAGADDFLTKPFSFSELLARKRALFRRPREMVPVELKIADLKLSPATREVLRDGKNIGLTLKEFELLQYLMRHPGQVLGREDIFVHLWDFADTGFSNVIDVHIKNLRRKVDAHYDKKLIKTIRGVGYSISE